MRPTRPTLRTILFRLHWAFGLTAGLVLALVGVTGALMSYEDAAMDALNAERAAVQAGGRTRLGPEALVAAIEAAHPGLRVAALTLAADPARAARVRFTGSPAERAPSRYLDPYDGADRGTVAGEKTFETIRSLHRWLLLPGGGRGWGRTITGISALALLAFLGTGLYLRWPKLHSWRIWLRPSLARPGRPRWWSLHAVVGTWLVPVYLVIGLTGLWWSYDSYRAGATYLLTGAWPETRPQGEGGRMEERRAGAKAAPPPLALDAAWRIFTAETGDRAALATVTLPAGRERTIRIRYLADADDAPSARSEMHFDAGTGALLTTAHAADKSLGKRIAENMLEVHRGRFFGGVFALIFCLAALAMPVFAATGITLYVLRRRAARKRAAPAVRAEPVRA
ncbi:PepSY-associated TM helix domain-containing protein [Methylobacterium dankookense]|uniref:PepSY domain-containing protein n=1 Tax=Methylobacterium dankookense TaxID=560405 RepID=A0A564FYD3_9HYPH|nr:PepSY-associated TM helix domain-containing protein [Methylobacterium dankookense]GJD54307.1 hypothetical protein IFDJLNFL_0177 [Methylobacterium dankookense]VUF13002.1 hypothetical protein MTDSW087_02699 [Methylobacterium dankookense]